MKKYLALFLFTFLCPIGVYASTVLYSQPSSGSYLGATGSSYTIGTFTYISPKSGTLSAIDFYAGVDSDAVELEVYTPQGVCAVMPSDISVGSYDAPTLQIRATTTPIQGDCNIYQGDSVTVNLIGVHPYNHPSTRGNASGAMYAVLYALDNISILSPLDGSTSTTTTVVITTQYQISGDFIVGLDLDSFGIGTTANYSTSTEIVAEGIFQKEYVYTLTSTSTWYATAYIQNFFSGERQESKIIFHVISPSKEYLSQGETYDDIPCSITDLTGCFKKALWWAFVPSPDFFSGFSDIWDEIKKKPPFGYVTVTAQTVATIGKSEDPAYLLTVPDAIQTAILDPFKTGYTWLLIVALAFAMYHRFKEVQV